MYGRKFSTKEFDMTKSERWMLVYWVVGGMVTGYLAGLVTGIGVLGFIVPCLGYFIGKYKINKNKVE